MFVAANAKARALGAVKALAVVVVAMFLTACDDASAPPQAEIDRGVNWSLSDRIKWGDHSRNLFTSYKITNHYTESQGGYTCYVYDVDAICRVQVGGSFGSYGGTRSAFFQAGTFASGVERDETIKSSFTLVKKGQAWYAQETFR